VCSFVPTAVSANGIPEVHALPALTVSVLAASEILREELEVSSKADQLVFDAIVKVDIY
jgi:hypothetical protein